METEKVTEEVQDSLDSWDSYLSGNFLKAINVSSEADAYVVTGITEVEDPDGIKRPRLHLERNNTQFDFDLNKTNAAKVKELGITSPKSVVGKKIFFRKVLVRNPKTNQEVDGLRVSKVE